MRKFDTKQERKLAALPNVSWQRMGCIIKRQSSCMICYQFHSEFRWILSDMNMCIHWPSPCRSLHYYRGRPSNHRYLDQKKNRVIFFLLGWFPISCVCLFITHYIYINISSAQHMPSFIPRESWVPGITYLNEALKFRSLSPAQHSYSCFTLPICNK